LKKYKHAQTLLLPAYWGNIIFLKKRCNELGVRPIQGLIICLEVKIFEMG